MAMERRNAVTDYYYRKQRINGRVVSTYVGSGEEGRNRLQQENEAAALRKEEKAKQTHETEKLIAEIDQLCADVDHVFDAALFQAGYRRHNRGEWRKQRTPMNNPLMPPNQTILPAHSPNGPELSLAACDERAIVDVYGRRQEDLIATRMCAGDPEAFSQDREHIQNMQEALLAEGRSPTEVLLVRRVILCYMALHYFECLYFQAMKEHHSPKEEALSLIRMHQANDRYLGSLRSLEHVRKLKSPTAFTGVVAKLLSLSSQLPEPATTTETPPCETS